jgi:DNA invertase Pin-like site-specific DNA recombinase
MLRLPLALAGVRETLEFCTCATDLRSVDWEGEDMKRVAIYVRVSTGGQTTENQERELRSVAERAGWQIVNVYRDAGISGSKGRDGRPSFATLCKDAARRRFDMVAAWSVDRLSRSLHDLTGFLKDLQVLNIDLYLHQQGLDTTTPTGKAMFQMAGVFAELERAVIRERVMAGLARAKRDGKKLGRRPTNKSKQRKIERALSRGDRGIRKIARELGVGVGTVQRIKAAMEVSRVT